MEKFQVGNTEFQIVRGSALDQKTDVMVNAANRRMRGGGGIDGAIHQAAGPDLMTELIQKAPKGCHTGNVVVTMGHASPFRHIIHTPGPIFEGGDQGEADALFASYYNSIRTANIFLNAESVTFPPISTGVYRYPLNEAAKIGIHAVVKHLNARGPNNSIKLVVFAMFQEAEYDAFVQAARDLNYLP